MCIYVCVLSLHVRVFVSLDLCLSKCLNVRLPIQVCTLGVCVYVCLECVGADACTDLSVHTKASNDPLNLPPPLFQNHQTRRPHSGHPSTRPFRPTGLAGRAAAAQGMLVDRQERKKGCVYVSNSAIVGVVCTWHRMAHRLR